MGRFSGILLATDVDGTLVKGVDLSYENQQAIKYFVSEGGLFTVATGRSAMYINEHFSESLTINAPVIAVNGTIISSYPDFKMLWGRRIPESYKELLEFTKKEDVLTAAYLCDDNRIIMCSDVLPEGIFYKLVLVTQTPEQAYLLKIKLEEKFPEFHFSRSWETGLEATDIYAGKGIALNLLKQMTGAKVTVGVGNFENDLTLLKSSDISIAVFNATDDVKGAADYITENDADTAIAEIIEKLDKKQIKADF